MRMLRMCEWMVGRLVGWLKQLKKLYGILSGRGETNSLTIRSSWRRWRFNVTLRKASLNVFVSELRRRGLVPDCISMFWWLSYIKLKVFNPFRPNGKTLSQKFKCPQRPKGKTLSHNAMSFLKFSASIITHIFSQNLSKRLVQAWKIVWNLIQFKIITNNL
jgi:hypothetical protein